MAHNISTGSRSRHTTRASTTKLSGAPTIMDRVPGISPAQTLISNTLAGKKRKERDFESDMKGEETNIQVVVRCRGRNEREVRENSTFVVKTEGAKGKQIELCLGTNMLGNKAYNFDRVFSHAADQGMVYDDTVKPILDEMLSGYSCTIFAYGQTGTGKTYTMSGDMTDTMGILSDEAGIIPRVLQQLFNKLEVGEAEHCVKCSFIELYNEELRDLLSTDEGVSLKIYDEASRRGHASTLVQGMEEKHIKNAAEGIRVLQQGSFRRHVAATNFNDHSSRSHTVFTVTAYVKKANENGIEDLVCAGKLNLVDLAGSENVQRSGADNRRAAEAGMINKSLLTLGRVINALVDRSSHIPYRESKLTRLLQDSLGGRTKTCIIATISPVRSNLEETMSTLDYAFRAKNICNRPQLQAIPKNKLLKDLTSEIEKLKSELVSTRQRNGIHLSNEMYEGILAESESRRILIEEQGAKMETLDTNLRNKAQELFSLISSFTGLKKDHEATKTQLDETTGVLDQTQNILSMTRKTLAEEMCLRKAYEGTEEKLTGIGGELISRLQHTVNDITGLHAKDKRKSDLHSINRATWSVSQTRIADVTTVVEQRSRELQEEQRIHIASISKRMDAFIDEELNKLSSTQALVERQLDRLIESKRQLLGQKQESKVGMDDILEGIKETRDIVKNLVGDSLQLISRATEKLATGVLNEMRGFHSQLHSSYNSFGEESTSLFENLIRHIATQRCESDSLRRKLHSATHAIVLQNVDISTHVHEALQEERRQAAEDREKLLRQISTLVNQQAEVQEARLVDRAAQIQRRLAESNMSLEGAISHYGLGMDTWDEQEGQLLEEATKSRDQLKTMLEGDWATANEHSTSIQNAARSAHAEMLRAVNEQIGALGVQMGALGDFVTNAKSKNVTQYETDAQSFQVLSNTVEQSFSNILDEFKTTFDRVRSMGEEMGFDTSGLYGGIEALETRLCHPLANLREDISNTAFQEYQPTGATPQKVRYHYPTRLPRTETHDMHISTSVEMLQSTTEGAAEEENEDNCKHENTVACPESEHDGKTSSSLHEFNTSAPAESGLDLILHEVNPNVTMNPITGVVLSNPRASIMPGPAAGHTMPLLKHSTRSSRRMRMQGIVIDGRENQPQTMFAESLSKRKSPRLK